MTEAQEIPRSLAIEGEGHDRCGHCERDVEPVHSRTEGPNHYWDMYSCDLREGGCGNNWTATTTAGVAWNERKNQRTKWVSTAVAVGRVTSIPSAQYQANYDRIFRKETAA